MTCRNSSAVEPCASYATPESHQDCCVCGKQHPNGLGLTFHRDGQGGVVGSWTCDAKWQGYCGQAHGGVIAMVLDGAMTHVLMAQSITAVTGRMDVRYRLPLRIEQPVTIRGQIESQSPPLFHTQATIEQDGRIVAVAKAKFMQIDEDHFDDALNG